MKKEIKEDPDKLFTLCDANQRLKLRDCKVISVNVCNDFWTYDPSSKKYYQFLKETITKFLLSNAKSNIFKAVSPGFVTGEQWRADDPKILSDIKRLKHEEILF